MMVCVADWAFSHSSLVARVTGCVVVERWISWTRSPVHCGRPLAYTQLLRPSKKSARTRGAKTNIHQNKLFFFFQHGVCQEVHRSTLRQPRTRVGCATHPPSRTKTFILLRLPSGTHRDTCNASRVGVAEFIFYDFWLYGISEFFLVILFLLGELAFWRDVGQQ